MTGIGMPDDEQGGQLPAGWSGASWLRERSFPGQFMFGCHPMDERWRVIPDRHPLHLCCWTAAHPARAFQEVS